MQEVLWRLGTESGLSDIGAGALAVKKLTGNVSSVFTYVTKYIVPGIVSVMIIKYSTI